MTIFLANANSTNQDYTCPGPVSYYLIQAKTEEEATEIFYKFLNESHYCFEYLVDKSPLDIRALLEKQFTKELFDKDAFENSYEIVDYCWLRFASRPKILDTQDVYIEEISEELYNAIIESA